jgi:pimeloyl-ACP methyl ester carboxylesterase
MGPYYELAKAFRKRAPKANVLVVEWHVPNNGPVKIPWLADPVFLVLAKLLAPGLIEDYCRSALEATKVGGMIADELKSLGIRPSKTIICANSLGGQVAASVGLQWRESFGEPLHAIVASDPAGPLFQGYPLPQRLDETDALHVIVIHSTILLGDETALGTRDIYLVFQPGPDGKIPGLIQRHDSAFEALAACVKRRKPQNECEQLLDIALRSVLEETVLQ